MTSKVMAVVGSREMSPVMEAQTIEQTQKALDAGWRISTGGARGVDEAAMRAAINSGKAAMLDIYLPSTLDVQDRAVGTLAREAQALGANIIENAGAGGVSYAQSLFLRDQAIIRNSNAAVAIHNNGSRGTMHSVNAAKKLGIPIKLITYAQGILKVIERINMVMLPLMALDLFLTHTEIGNDLMDIDTLLNDWRNSKPGSEFRKRIEDILKTRGVNNPDVNSWNDVDPNTLMPLAGRKFKLNPRPTPFGNVGNPYRDAEGRFSTKSNAVRIIG